MERALEQLQLDLPGSAKLEIGPNEFGPPRYVFEYPLQYVEGKPSWRETSHLIVLYLVGKRNKTLLQLERVLRFGTAKIEYSARDIVLKQRA